MCFVMRHVSYGTLGLSVIRLGVPQVLHKRTNYLCTFNGESCCDVEWCCCFRVSCPDTKGSGTAVVTRRIVTDMTRDFELLSSRGVAESVWLYGQVNKRTWWMPWQPEAMKDVVGCDKPRGVAKHTVIRGFPNGETHSVYRVPCTEYIGVRSKRGELKHLSTRRKRNQLRFPQ